jgi:hypothetical protein
VQAKAPEPGVYRSPHLELGEAREPVQGEYPLLRPARGQERVLALKPPAAWAFRLRRRERAPELLPAALAVPGAFPFRARELLPGALQEE